MIYTVYPWGEGYSHIWAIQVLNRASFSKKTDLLVEDLSID